jgi:hypothetical protein
MKNGFRILGGALLAVALSSPALAGHGHGKGKGGGGGGESQAGGLPALEDRVEADEALIATLQGQVATLITEVATLTGDVATLESEVATLETEVADLAGQNSWAVVSAAGSVVRAKNGSDLVDPVTVEHVAASGVYDVAFSSDVSGCAYTATIGDTGTGVPSPGFVSVSGDVDADSKDDVTVYTFDKTGAAADASFHLYVSCN